MTSGSSLNDTHIDGYFDRIQLPAKYRRSQNPALDLSFLSIIQAYHLSAIPFENTALHYAKDTGISLKLDDIYEKIVLRHHGGYCMESNILLNHVLRSLGFHAYMTGARLNGVGSIKHTGWSGWIHAVNLVTLQDGSRYLVDVAYGGNGPRVPLPLTGNIVTRNIATQDARITRDVLPDFVDNDQKLWIYQIRNSADVPWTPAYAFTDIEFLHRDFEVMSFYTSKNPDSSLTAKLIAVKYLRKGDEIHGKITLEHENLKENLGEKNVLVKTCVTEKQRAEVLETWFGIKFSDQERRYIDSVQ